MEPIQYRLFRPGEAGEYRRVRLLCLKENPAAFATSYEEEQAKEKLRFQEAIETADPDDFVMGAFQDNTCVGMCGHMRERKAKTAHVGKLLQIYVVPALQGKGIGAELIDRTVKFAFEERGLKMITLDVVAGNDKALTTYTRLGFEPYGHLKNYMYHQGQHYDEVLMVRYKADN